MYSDTRIWRKLARAMLNRAMVLVARYTHTHSLIMMGNVLGEDGNMHRLHLRSVPSNIPARPSGQIARITQYSALT